MSTNSTTGSRIMTIDSALFNTRFVNEVEKYPCLYNTSLTDYSRKDITENAWDQLCEKLEIPKWDAKEKWKNLRAVYIRHMKPVLTGIGIKKKRPYYLSDAMHFTLPYIKSLAVSPESPAEEVFDISDNMEDYKVQITTSKPQYHSWLEEETIAEEPESCAEKSFDRKRKYVNNEVDSSGVEYVKDDKVVVSNHPSSENSSKKMFLLSLLPELDEMNHKQMKVFRRKVFRLIDDVMETVPSTSSRHMYSPASDSQFA